ncbi:hypothetical protein D3C78_1395610 [compost metagenome]
MTDDVVDAQAQTGDTRVGQLIDDHCQVRRSTTGTAIFDIHVGQDHAHLATGEPGLAVGAMVFTPLVFTGRQGIDYKAADAVGEGFDICVHPGRAVIVQHGGYLEFCCCVAWYESCVGAGHARDRMRSRGHGRFCTVYWIPASRERRIEADPRSPRHPRERGEPIKERLTGCRCRHRRRWSERKHSRIPAGRA